MPEAGRKQGLKDHCGAGAPRRLRALKRASQRAWQFSSQPRTVDGLLLSYLFAALTIAAACSASGAADASARKRSMSSTSWSFRPSLSCASAR